MERLDLTHYRGAKCDECQKTKFLLILTQTKWRHQQFLCYYCYNEELGLEKYFCTKEKLNYLIYSLKSSKLSTNDLQFLRSRIVKLRHRVDAKEKIILNNQVLFRGYHAAFELLLCHQRCRQAEMYESKLYWIPQPVIQLIVKHIFNHDKEWMLSSVPPEYAIPKAPIKPILIF